MIYSSQQVIPEATVCIQLVLPLKVHWYWLKQWIWHFAALKRAVILEHARAVKMESDSRQSPFFRAFTIFCLSSQQTFFNNFCKAVFGGITLNLQAEQQNHAQNTYFCLCGNFTELFCGKLSPSYSPTTCLKTANALQLLLCSVMLVCFFFLPSLYHCQFCSGRF